MFDNFPKLLALSQGLVYHGDPLNPEPGKVGLEIEFTKSLPWKSKLIQDLLLLEDGYQEKDYEEDGERETMKEFYEWCLANGLEDCWFIGFDQFNGDTGEHNKELKRHKDWLSHDGEFVASFLRYINGLETTQMSF